MLNKGPGGFFLAGGTDLVIAMKERDLSPRYVVDLKRIPDLAGIHANADGGFTIGALTRLYEIEKSPAIMERHPFLAQSAVEIGSTQIRQRGTIGGNVVNASPSADIVPCLLALDTKVCRLIWDIHKLHKRLCYGYPGFISSNYMLVGMRRSFADYCEMRA